MTYLASNLQFQWDMSLTQSQFSADPPRTQGSLGGGPWDSPLFPYFDRYIRHVIHFWKALILSLRNLQNK